MYVLLFQLSQALAQKSAALVQADTALGRQEALSGFVLDGLIDAAKPKSGDPTTTVRQALLSVESKLEVSFTGDPDLAAWVRQRVGRFLGSIGCYREAEQNLQASYDTLSRLRGADDEDTLIAATALANVYSLLDKDDDAIALQREVVQIRRITKGDDDPLTVKALCSLGNRLYYGAEYDEAKEILLETIRRALEIQLAETVVVATNTLANVYYGTRDFDQAEINWNQALTLLHELGPGKYKPEEAHSYVATHALISGSLLITPGVSPTSRHKFEDKLDVFLDKYGGESTGGGTMLDGSGSDLDFTCEPSGFEDDLKSFLVQNANVNAIIRLTNLDESYEIFTVECVRQKKWWQFW